jgi:hypothetical protein
MIEFKVVFYSGGMYLSATIQASGFNEAATTANELGKAIFKIEWIITSLGCEQK